MMRRLGWFLVSFVVFLGFIAEVQRHDEMVDSAVVIAQ